MYIIHNPTVAKPVIENVSPVSAAPDIFSMVWQPRIHARSSDLSGNFLPSQTASKTDDLHEHQRVFEASRPTTDQENLMGEIREFSLLEANWDGEGALKPSSQSIRDASAFVRLMDAHASFPEPVLHVSGNVALFWDQGDALYADVEFLGGNSVAYFIKTNQGRHKGVVSFDSEQMPTVLAALLA